MRILATISLTLLLGKVMAQGLTPDAFIKQVLENHPEAKNADLMLDMARKQMTSARGNFDPILYGGATGKNYDESEYFDIKEGGVKLPTRLGGLELKAAYQVNDGVRLNPQNYTPEDGLVIAGASLPVGKGLFTDKARTSLKQVSNDKKSAPFERQLSLMNLILNAQKVYWNWVYSDRSKEVFEEALDLAKFRFVSVKARYETGDLAAVDTLEAFIQLQNRQAQLQDANISFYANSYQLNNFLWKDKLETSKVDTSVCSAVDWESMLNWKAETLNPVGEHPAIRVYQFKVQNLVLDKRLKLESLKPELDIHYNFLSGANEPLNERFDPVLTDNYKFGVSAKFPLFVRKGIGDVGMANVKIRSTENDLILKSRELENKQKASILNISFLGSQVDVLEENVSNYRRLLEAERQKFRNGESSLFLVNSRESKLIESELKLAKTRSAFMKEIASFQWANGSLVQ